MNHQEQNREALIRHIADLEAVIRRRNEQIDNQAHNARETQRAREEMARERDEARAEAHNWRASAEELEKQRDAASEVVKPLRAADPRPLDSEVTDEEWLDARYEAALDHVGGDKAAHLDPMTIFMIGAKWDRQYAESRPLTADDITDEMVRRGAQVATPAGVRYLRPHEVREILTAALTEPPTRPEGAEKVEAVLHQYWSGDINGDDLADRIAEEMNR